MKVIISFCALVLVILIGLNLMRNFDDLRSYRVWQKLEKTSSKEQRIFSPEMVENLPEPARRYFEYTILPGAPLKRVANIQMSGRLGLGPKDAPDYMEMQAKQIMGFPDGFVWNIKTGRGPMVITGSDGFYQDKSWSRFWLMHTIPVVRAGGTSEGSVDHHKSAFGRLVAEAVFWSPAALLPSESVSWDEIGPNSARATVKHQGLVQTVDIYLNEEGQPTHVIIPRWSDTNSGNVYQLQPFGGYLSDYKEIEGYRLPMHVEGGNFIGTDQYFPFYIADIEALTFVD